MADNINIQDGDGSTAVAATDELSDSSHSPKVSLVDGTGSPTPISPATAGRQDTGNSALSTIDGHIQALNTYVQQSGVIGHGAKTVASAGTDEALAGSTACRWVMIQALQTNTDDVAVGGASVDVGTNGIILGPRDAVTFAVNNLNLIRVDSLVNGEGVRYVYGV